jgi:hypothetical protein
MNDRNDGTEHLLVHSHSDEINQTVDSVETMGQGNGGSDQVKFLKIINYFEFLQ